MKKAAWKRDEHGHDGATSNRQNGTFLLFNYKYVIYIRVYRC